MNEDFFVLRRDAHVSLPKAWVSSGVFVSVFFVFLVTMCFASCTRGAVCFFILILLTLHNHVGHRCARKVFG